MNQRPVQTWAVLAVAFTALGLFPARLDAQAAPSPKEELHKETGAAPAAEAEEDFWSRVSLEAGFQIDSGKYGGKKRSTFLSFPATLGYDHDGVIASVSVPYVLQRTHGNVVRVGGRVVRVGGKAQHQAKTEGGLGDILVDAGYYVVDSQDEVPYLLLDGEIKIPTADDERGLGTGAPDETIRATTGVTLWKHLKLTAELGYQFTGQPEDIPSSTTDFHDVVVFGGGVGYKFDSSNTLWAKFDGTTELAPHTAPYEVVYFEYDHTFKNDSRLLFTVGFGLTSASPGLSLELAYLIWF
jgi:hypothetical protein